MSMMMKVFPIIIAMSSLPASGYCQFLDSASLLTAMEKSFVAAQTWRTDALPTTLMIHGDTSGAKGATITFFCKQDNSTYRNAILTITADFTKPHILSKEYAFDNKIHHHIWLMEDRKIASPTAIFAVAKQLGDEYRKYYPGMEFVAMLKGERLGETNKMLWNFRLTAKTEGKQNPLIFFVNAEDLEICCIGGAETKAKDAILSFLAKNKTGENTYRLPAEAAN